MSTYQIFVSTDGGATFTHCNIMGIYKSEAHADMAAKVMAGLSPGIYEVRQSVRGRKPGQKDTKPRKKRGTKEILARIIDTEGTVNDTEPVDGDDAGVSMSEVAEQDNDIPPVLSTEGYVPLSEAQLNEIMSEAPPSTVAP